MNLNLDELESSRNKLLYESWGGKLRSMRNFKLNTEKVNTRQEKMTYCDVQYEYSSDRFKKS